MTLTPGTLARVMKQTGATELSVLRRFAEITTGNSDLDRAVDAELSAPPPLALSSRYANIPAQGFGSRSGGVASPGVFGSSRK